MSELKNLPHRVWDWDKDGSHNFIGETQANLNFLQSNFRAELENTNKKVKKIGILKVVEFKSTLSYSLLDYMTGGLDMSLMVAIDFTESNGHPANPQSLHYLGSHKIIFSPNVPFICNDNGDLLDAFYSCNVITCAAVNAGYVKKNYTDIKLANEYIFTTMKERIRRILEVALRCDTDALILCAWGCGVFRNSPDMIANLFGLVLKEYFYGAFPLVTFAIASKDNTTVPSFTRALSSQHLYFANQSQKRADHNPI
ncbi:hypothetical protein RFI_35709 [Reticulomyxa filosa]|uniref:Microbial-type PARG catalytic domain-containing protein n=1 Tax=Reticulomyxa filosa TaxID=46433 RepID=X6LLW6_RETFI|nr:hypothetical protein RFI_35709 [Reticulomyxa filosa]|eukprot:ETO01730.1 hypothetical protein RFI_35709 [Reticulomyxa filosa]